MKLLAGLLLICCAAKAEPIAAEFFDARLNTYQLQAGKCSEANFSLFGVTKQMTIVVTPTENPGPVTWQGRVVEPNVVAVRICALETATPLATSYQVRAF